MRLIDYASLKAIGFETMQCRSEQVAKSEDGRNISKPVMAD
jgi:hypothetical protein